jgi:hypothetical protein
MLRRVIRITIYSLLGAVLVLAAAMVGLYLHTPGWYQPIKLTDEQQQAASGDLIATMSDLNKQAIYSPPDEPFTVTISQEDLNRYLQAAHLLSPQAAMPAWLRDPVVVLQPGRVILAGHVPAAKDRPIALHLNLRFESEHLAIEVESVTVGSLPLPQQMIRDQLADLGQQFDASKLKPKPHAKSGKPADQEDLEHPLGGQLADLAGGFLRAVNGQPMSCSYVTPNSHRPIRLVAIKIVEGSMTLTFAASGKPLERLQLPD